MKKSVAAFAVAAIMAAGASVSSAAVLVDQQAYSQNANIAEHGLAVGGSFGANAGFGETFTKTSISEGHHGIEFKNVECSEASGFNAAASGGFAVGKGAIQLGESISAQTVIAQ